MTLPVYDEKTGYVLSPEETARLADGIIKEQLMKQAKDSQCPDESAHQKDIALFRAKVTTIQRY